MLRKFAAALVATTLMAGAAVAAPPAGNAGATAAASAPAAPASVNAVTKETGKPAKTVKRVRKHFGRHVARGEVAGIKVARHLKSTKAHRHHLAAHAVKPAKVGKGAKSGA